MEMLMDAKDYEGLGYKLAQKRIYMTIKPLIDEIYTKNSMDREERERVHKLYRELAFRCGERE